MFNFPPHKVSLTLTHNDHKNVYSSVEEYISDVTAYGQCDIDWISEQEKQKAIETNEMWTLQWYPTTPIGSHCFYASSLEALLEYCNKLET